MAVNIHITIIELNALHTKRQNLFQELDAVIHLLMEAKHWGLRKSRNATSLNSRFKSLDTLKVKIISVTFRRVIRTNHKKASKIWRHENIQLGGLYFDSLTVKAGNGGFLDCIQMDTSVNASSQVVSVGADIAFDADPKFFACLVRFESSSVPTTLPTAYDVYPLDGRHDGGYYTVKDCVTIDVLPRTPGNNVYVGFMVWSNFTATKCRGLVSLNQVIKEIICLQPLK